MGDILSYLTHHFVGRAGTLHRMLERQGRNTGPAEATDLKTELTDMTKRLECLIARVERSAKDCTAYVPVSTGDRATLFKGWGE